MASHERRLKHLEKRAGIEPDEQMREVIKLWQQQTAEMVLRLGPIDPAEDAEATAVAKALLAWHADRYYSLMISSAR